MSTFQEIINSKELVLVDFSAEWCGPCKMQAPILKELAGHVPTDRVKIIKIDVDKNPALSAQMHVSGVPTLILYKNGKQIWRQSGMVPLHHLKNIIYSNLSA